MRVLFINSSRGWGGGEVWSKQICSGLVARGHRVMVACREDSELIHSLEGSGAEVVPLRSWGDFSPDSIWKLVCLIRDRRVDVVCTNWEKDLRLGGVAALWAGVPVVPSKETDVPIRDSWLNRLFYGRIASALLVNSYSTYRTVITNAPWLERQQVRVIWKGTEAGATESIATADLKSQFQLRDDDVIAGFVGRLDEQKGIRTLLDAMRLLVKRYPRLKLVLVGDGNLRESTEQFIRSNGLQRQVFMMGFLKIVTPVLRAIDFLVMPSNWEGFGYSAIEGMAMGKAVIGTRVSSLPEIVKDGETGILVPPRSPHRLAAAMELLAGDREARSLLGASGSKRVRELFSLNRMVTETESFFLELTQRGARSTERELNLAVFVPDRTHVPTAQSVSR